MRQLEGGHRCLAIVAAWALFGTAGCAEMTTPTTQVTGSGGPSVNEAVGEAYDGAKARLAVAHFVVKAPKAKDVIGDGLADMLATALFQSNRYIVLERQALGVVVAEQDLGASGRVRPETGAKIGQIEGAELLVIGAVTEFEPGESGAKATFGAGLGGAADRLAGGKSGKGEAIGGLMDSIMGAVKTSHVAIDLRIIDARTSRVVGATSVEGKATDFDLGGLGRLAGTNLGVGLSAYARTPMEKAIRLAIQDAVRFVTSKTPPDYYRYRETAGTAVATPGGKSGEVHALGAAPANEMRPPATAGQAAKPVVAASPTPALTPVAVTPTSAGSPPVSAPKVLYIKAAQANVRVEPSTGAKILTSVKRATKLVVLDGRNQWYQVKLEDGSEGWVAASVTSSQPD